MQGEHPFGTGVLFLSLLLTATVLPREYRDSSGLPVLLPHICTPQERLNKGDSRDVFVRYRSDHSSFVNNRLMPVEGDLRHEIAGLMATRWVQVIFFAADDGMVYREVSDVISDLQHDDPNLSIFLLTSKQMGSAEMVPRDLCMKVGP
jgi:hypothetical protein